MMRALILSAVSVTAIRVVAADTRPAIAERVVKLTRDSSWTSVTSVPIAFTTYHPQGMVKIGDDAVRVVG